MKVVSSITAANNRLTSTRATTAQVDSFNKIPVSLENVVLSTASFVDPPTKYVLDKISRSGELSVRVVLQPAAYHCLRKSTKFFHGSEILPVTVYLSPKALTQAGKIIFTAYEQDTDKLVEASKHFVEIHGRMVNFKPSKEHDIKTWDIKTWCGSCAEFH